MRPALVTLFIVGALVALAGVAGADPLGAPAGLSPANGEDVGDPGAGAGVGRFPTLRACSTRSENVSIETLDARADHRFEHGSLIALR